MAFVAIHGFEPHPVDQNMLLNRWIDLPAPKTTHHSYSIRLEGWLLFKQVQPIRIEVRLSGLRIAVSKTFVERPDVLHHFNQISDTSALGFYCEINTLLLPAAFEMQIVVLFEDSSEVSIGTIKGDRSIPAESVPSKLQPFSVYALGRSGTTLMMRYLLNHPQIVAYDRYPYEVRMMRYFYHTMRILTSRADHKSSAHPDYFAIDPYHLGYNPYYEPAAYGDTIADWFNASHIEEVAAFCKRSLDNFYLTLGQAQGKTDLRLFAEKNDSGNVGLHQWLLYPESRGILLVRDFRDRHCSALSFNKKRGHDAFGYENNGTEELFAENTLKDFRIYQAYAKLYPSQIMLVRYEDLIQKPRETITEIFEHAGLDVHDPVVDEVMRLTHVEDTKLQQHQTSKEAKSIGRWKTDIDPNIASLYLDLMGDIMAELGYEV